MAGHVFVTQSDVLQLHCDAWLLPGDAALGVTAGFRGAGGEAWAHDLARWHRRDRALPQGWGDDGIRVLPLATDADRPPVPRPFLVNVGGWEGTPIDWYMAGVHQFCEAVATSVEAQVTKRPVPLIAVPLVGTGAGGGIDKKGDIIRALLMTLYNATCAHDLDFVVVARTATAHAAVRHARHQLASATPSIDPWLELDGRLVCLADDLARRARSGHLVLFLGAGVRMGAGRPSWDGLLDGLAREAGMDADQLTALGKLHATDRARIIEMRLAAHGIDLGARICAQLVSTRYALAHSLLATLPVTEVVTLNYDRLLELAAEATGHPVAVLPYQPSTGRDRWLLKMHGRVQHPDDIVLTREDYLRYADRRAALSGIVQALLITRHMLFVGFSLIDDNFQRIVDDVRKALGGAEVSGEAPQRFGTALTLDHKPLLAELWRDSVRTAGVTGSGEAPPGSGDAARRLDIVLDRVLAEATRGTVPLLDERYDGILTDQEKQIRTLLTAVQGADDEVRRSPAWQPVARLLRELGAPDYKPDHARDGRCVVTPTRPSASGAAAEASGGRYASAMTRSRARVARQSAAARCPPTAMPCAWQARSRLRPDRPVAGRCAARQAA